MCINEMFIEALIKIASNWRQPKCSPMINEETTCHIICIMEYYAVIKMNHWHLQQKINFKRIMLSKISQTQKTTYYMIVVIWSSRKR